MKENAQRFFEFFIAIILIIIVVPILMESVKSEINIDDMQCIAIYNEDGTLHSLDGDLNNRVVTNQNEAAKIIKEFSLLFEVPACTDFKCINIQESITGTTYMFVQTIDDIEIAGTYVTLVTNDDILTAITMDIDRHITKVTAHRLSKETVSTIALDRGEKTHSVKSIEEYIIDGDLYYMVYLIDEENIFALNDMKVFVDAATKEAKTERQIASMIDTIEPYYNKEETPSLEGVDDCSQEEKLSQNDKKAVSYFAYNEQEYLYNPQRNIQVISMEEDYAWPLEMVEVDGIGLPANLATADTELGQVIYVNLIQVYDWYKERYDRQSYDDNNGDITCLVGLDTLNDNAAYWDAIDAFLVGKTQKYDKSPAMFLDVIAHEYTHAIFQDINNTLVRSGETEGINEAYADIFGCLIDGDWVIAEGIKEGKALSDPSNSGIKLVRNRTYPVTYKDEYWSKTDGHINGILLTRIVYEMTQQGFNNDEIADIWYQSMFYGYSDNSTYLTVRYNVEKAMRALGYETEQINKVSSLFDEVNIA